MRFNQTVGGVLTIAQAQEHGLLDAAEALQKEPGKPWKLLTPSEMPTEVVADAPDKVQNEEPQMADKKSNVSLHRALSHLNKGGLHRALGVPEGESIPADKLESAKNSDNPHIAHMAQFATVMSHFKK